MLDQKPYNHEKFKMRYYSMKYNFVMIGTVDDGFESKDAALDFLQEIMTKDKKICEINTLQIFSESS